MVREFMAFIGLSPGRRVVLPRLVLWRVRAKPCLPTAVAPTPPPLPIDGLPTAVVPTPSPHCPSTVCPLQWSPPHHFPSIVSSHEKLFLS